MIKVFSLVLDLLEIPFSTEHLVLAQKLIETPSHKIISFYAYGFVFFAFQDFLLGKISQEEFVAFGDSFGILQDCQNNPVLAKEALIYGLNSDLKIYENTFILFPKNEKLFLEKEVKSLSDILKKKKSQIIYL